MAVEKITPLYNMGVTKFMILYLTVAFCSAFRFNALQEAFLCAKLVVKLISFLCY